MSFFLKNSLAFWTLGLSKSAQIQMQENVVNSTSNIMAKLEENAPESKIRLEGSVELVIFVKN